MAAADPTKIAPDQRTAEVTEWFHGYGTQAEAIEPDERIECDGPDEDEDDGDLNLDVGSIKIPTTIDVRRGS